MKTYPSGRSQSARDSGYLAEPTETSLKKIIQL